MNFKRVVVFAVLAFAVVGAGAWSVWYVRSSNNPQPQSVQSISTEKFTDPTTGLQLEYVTGLHQDVLTQEDTSNKIILRLGRSTPETILVTARHEKGIRKSANLTRQDPLALMIDGASRSLSLRYPSYKELNQKTFDLNGHRAGELVFTYQLEGAAKVAKQRLLIVLKNDDEAVIIAMQTDESSFDSVNTTYFEPIAKSVKF
jgi:hypothetical protein